MIKTSPKELFRSLYNISCFSFTGATNKQILDLTRRPLNLQNSKLPKFGDISENSQELKKMLYSRLKSNGPISLDEYMNICLYDKNYGYYTTKEHIFGEKGDFITAPEVSQMFGETISIFLYKILENSFKFPHSWDLLEVGAGRGFLMADILASFVGFKCLRGLNVIIVEKSNKLTKIQQENINNILLKKGIVTEYQYDKENKIDKFVDKKNRFTLTWFDSLDKYITYRNGVIVEDSTRNPMRSIQKLINVKENPKLNPLMIINNELFDALPTKKFVFSNNYWREVLVDVDEGQKSDDLQQNIIINQNSLEVPKNLNEINFKFTLSAPNNENVVKYLDPQNTFVEQGIKVKEGEAYEFSPEQVRYMYAMSYLMATTVDAQALIIDYGEDHAFSDSFRGIKNQKVLKNQEILNNSGGCDLTSYVNFKALKKVVYNYKSLKIGGLIKQADFLEILQIYQRLKLLQSSQSSIKNKELLMRQYEKLTAENQMGDTYKFFYIHKTMHKPSYPFIEEILNQLKEEE
jgi:NADH dehydrogenase [ubiquinone] 1 alpha subcomplex assembly factor 7